MTVVLASRGYPETSSKGDEIRGLRSIDSIEVEVLHAGTAGFGLASLAAGLAQNVDMLLTARVTQGIFAGLMVWMYVVLAHKPGGQPIGALERAFARATKLIGRLIRRGRRRGFAAS